MFLCFPVIALGVQRAIWGRGEALMNHASSWLNNFVWELLYSIFSHFIAFRYPFLF